MDEYIKREDALKALRGLPNVCGCSAVDRTDAEDAIMDCHTTDVVPRSEVERLEHLRAELSKEVDRLKDDNKFLQDRRFKEWSEVRQEVAREIFARVRKAFYDVSSVTHNELTNAILDDNQYRIDLVSGIDGVLRAVRGIIEEFAKEYAKGGG